MLYEEWCSAGKLDTDAYQINEGDISDLLHFVGDVSAAVADTVVPGSGAVLDVINMLSYWVEAHLASKSTEKIKLILSGIIQAFAIFDPFNGISTALKTGLNKVISAITTKSPATIAAARVAAKQVSDGLTALLTGLTGFASKMVTSLSNSKFGSAKFGIKPPAALIFLAPEGRPIELTISLLKIAEPFPAKFGTIYSPV